MSLLGNYNFIILDRVSPGDVGSRGKPFHRFDRKDKRLTRRFYIVARVHMRTRARGECHAARN